MTEMFAAGKIQRCLATRFWAWFPVTLAQNIFISPRPYNNSHWSTIVVTESLIFMEIVVRCHCPGHHLKSTS